MDQNSLPSRAALGLHMHRLSQDTIEPQGARNPIPCRAGHGSARHGQNRDPLGPEEKRHGECDRACRLGAPVPGDHDRSADLSRGPGRGDQNRPTTLEQSLFQAGGAWTIAARSGAADDDDVERPTIIANERIIFEGVPQPAEREPVRLLASFWDCMRVHKGFEPLTGRLDHLSLCGLIQHGRREHHFERNDVAKIGADGEPFDVALHTPAHEKSRFENGGQTAVLLDRNQNGFHGRHPNSEQGYSWQYTSSRSSTNASWTMRPATGSVARGARPQLRSSVIPRRRPGDLAIKAAGAAIYCDDEFPVAVVRSLVDGIEALVVT